MKILIIGGGYLGSRCASEWPDSVVSNKIISTAADALEILDKHKPDAVLNAAGIVGKPNVDWCETHQLESMIGNTVLPILIAEACQKKNIYLLHMGTGCVYYGYSPDGQGWKENDFANPSAVYTRTKYAADLCLSTLPNVGIARIRMPVDYLPSPGNLLDKVFSFKKLINVENSVTVLEDMIKVFHQLLKKKATGIFHVTNPGTIKYRDLVDIYKEIIDPTFSCEWISEEQLVSEGFVSKKRSNNILYSDNLAKLGITMRPIHEAMRDTLVKYKETLKTK